TCVRILRTGVLTDPSSIVPTRDHPNGKRLRASRRPSRGENKRTQTRSTRVTSRFRNHWRDLALRISRGDQTAIELFLAGVWEADVRRRRDECAPNPAGRLRM